MINKFPRTFIESPTQALRGRDTSLHTGRFNSRELRAFSGKSVWGGVRYRGPLADFGVITETVRGHMWGSHLAKS